MDYTTFHARAEHDSRSADLRKCRDQKVMAMHSSLTAAKRSEFMYLSPPLGNTVTIIFPLFSSLDAT